MGEVPTRTGSEALSNRPKHATSSVFLFCSTDQGWRLGLIHHPRFGRWMLPGGHVEPHENPAEAAVREVSEETGITCLPADPTRPRRPARCGRAGHARAGLGGRTTRPPGEAGAGRPRAHRSPLPRPRSPGRCSLRGRTALRLVRRTRPWQTSRCSPTPSPAPGTCSPGWPTPPDRSPSPGQTRSSPCPNSTDRPCPVRSWLRHPDCRGPAGQFVRCTSPAVECDVVAVILPRMAATTSHSTGRQTRLLDCDRELATSLCGVQYRQ